MSVKKKINHIPIFSRVAQSVWSGERQMTHIVSVTDNSCSQFDDSPVTFFGIASLYTVAPCAERNDNYTLKHCVRV